MQESRLENTAHNTASAVMGAFARVSSRRWSNTPTARAARSPAATSIAGRQPRRSRATTSFFSDYCTAILRSFRIRDGKAVDQFDWKAALDPEYELAKIATFGEDNGGELFLITHEGPIFKFVRR
jgi:hypothetical protein